MTHTLHRSGSRESLQDDYIVFAMSAKGMNERGSAPKLQEFLKMALKYNPTNYGDMKTGNSLVKSDAQLMDGVQDVSIVHAVFHDTDTVAALLNDLARADLGVSVVVSGLTDEAAQCCHHAHLEPHTVEYSLGIWGKTELLPEPAIRDVTTMCGHGQVSAGLVQRLVKQIKRGKLTCEQAADLLAKPCVCGVFNRKRAAALLQRMVES